MVVVNVSFGPWHFYLCRAHWSGVGKYILKPSISRNRYWERELKNTRSFFQIHRLPGIA